MAAVSKVWVYGRSLDKIAGSNPGARELGCLSLVSDVCWQVEAYATR